MNKLDSPIRIIILGSGFAAIQVLKKLQQKYKNNANVNIKIISKDNFFLFTPMLPEVFSGMIEPRHIITPIRSFCEKSAQFFQGHIQNIDFKKKMVTLKYTLGKYYNPSKYEKKEFEFDYLVIAVGNETNYFENKDIEKNCFSMKTINDAFILRNHIIKILEQANLEYSYHTNLELIKSLLTFVVIGGGFSGIETLGELNRFVKESIHNYYKNINLNYIRIVLVNAEDKILTEVDKDLGEYAKNILEKKEGIEFKMDKLATGITSEKLILKDNETISTYTVIWTAGVTPSKFVKSLSCSHDSKGRIKTTDTLEVENYREIYAIGDCASTINPSDGNPYPPTAQHAIKQGDLAAKNIIQSIEGKRKKRIKSNTKGTMATIGKKTGVAKIFQFKIRGFKAWLLWRSFYLSQLPNEEKIESYWRLGNGIHIS